jgi:hypothetical protein
MSILRICVYSLVSLACVLAAFFCRARSEPGQAKPRSSNAGQIQARDAFDQGLQAFKNVGNT